MVPRPFSFSRLRLPALALLVAAPLLLVGCKPPEAAKKDEKKSADAIKREKPFLTPVVAERVVRRDVRATIASTGSVIPLGSRLLRTEEAGRLLFAKPWQEGDYVEKGTVVARIDSDSLEGDILRAKADLALQDEALAIGRKSMDSAVRDYQTLQDLYSRGIAALKDVDASKLSMDRAINSHRQNQINRERSRASLQTLEDRLERLEVRAPFDGLLVARMTLDGSKPFQTAFGSEVITDYEGRLVGSDFAPCGIVDVRKVYVRCDVTSRDIGSVRLDQEAEVTIFATQDVVRMGRVANISRAASQDSRAFQVDVLVENPDRILRPGMFGRVEITTEVRRAAVSIRKDVITRRNNRSVAYVVEKEEGAAYAVSREVDLELGLEGRDEVEVTFGLKEGDGLIIRGFEVLQDKSPISPLFADDPTRPATAPTPEPTPVAPKPEKKGS